MLKKYNTLSEIISLLESYQHTYHVMNDKPLKFVYYARDVDTYFVVRTMQQDVFRVITDRDGKKANVYEYYTELRALNQFGGHIVDESDDADETEVEFVPVALEHTDDTYGRAMFLDTSTYSEEESSSSDSTSMIQPYPVSLLEEGKKEEKSEYYSVIYVGFYKGVIPVAGKCPYPIIDSVEVTEEWKYQRYDFSLRLSKLFDADSSSSPYRYNIDPTQKFNFSFLADKMPNVRAVFHINGKRFICEKLTGTFTDGYGMSRLVKGVFYQIV
jgi:hypothetical protein